MSTERSTYQQFPHIMNALYAPGKALAKTSLDKKLLALVNMRASQMNGCAFCLHLHALEAEAFGEERKRLDVLAAWRETQAWFTPRECAALAWTEALTDVKPGSVSDDLYARIGEHFSEEEVAELTLCITAINAWNRFNVAYHRSPDHAEAVFRQLHPAAAV